MSIIKAVIQAVLQAIAWVIPISESGHSAIFHDFSSRYTNACSQLTGVIHIGIAIGITAAFYKLFIQLFKTFFNEWADLFRNKKIELKATNSRRSFMYMTLLSFLPMIFYLIPTGKYGNVYSLFHRGSYNGNVLGEGLCMALLGALLLVTSSIIGKKLNPLPKWLQALVLGVIVFLALPSAGCSVIGGILCVGILVGLSDKYALRYSAVISVMVLLVTGVIEICIGVTTVTFMQVVFALIFSVATAYLAVKVLIYIIKQNQLKYIAVYDISVGLICFVIGFFQILAK